MNLIDRYIFTKIARLYFAILVGLLILISLFIFTSRIEWLTQQQQSLAIIGEFVIANQANFVLVTSPIVFVLSGAVVLSGLVGDKEWNAISAAGTSDFRIFRAFVILVLILIAMEAWLGHIGQPAGKRWIRDIFSKVSADLVGTLAQPQSFQQISEGLRFFIQSRSENGGFQGLVIVDERAEEETRMVFAREAAIQSQEGRYVLTIKNGKIIRFDARDFDRTPVEVDFKQYQFDLFSAREQEFQITASLREDEISSRNLFRILRQRGLDLTKEPPNELVELGNRIAANMSSLVMLLLLFHFAREIATLRASFVIPVTVLVVMAVLYIIMNSIFRRWSSDSYTFWVSNLCIPLLFMILASQQKRIVRLLRGAAESVNSFALVEKLLQNGSRRQQAAE